MKKYVCVASLLVLSACGNIPLFSSHTHAPNGAVVVAAADNSGTTSAAGVTTSSGGSSSSGSGRTGGAVGTTDFHIKAATGNAPWNTVATAYVVKKGDTFKVCNDDTTMHYVHASSGIPHGTAPILTGQCQSFTATAALALGNSVYDHLSGPANTFFLQINAQ